MEQQQGPICHCSITHPPYFSFFLSFFSCFLPQIHASFQLLGSKKCVKTMTSLCCVLAAAFRSRELAPFWPLRHATISQNRLESIGIAVGKCTRVWIHICLCAHPQEPSGRWCHCAEIPVNTFYYKRGSRLSLSGAKRQIACPLTTILRGFVDTKQQCLGRSAHAGI